MLKTKESMAFKMLNTKEAADYLAEMYGIILSINTLAQWRYMKKGPKYLKLPGSSRVFYTEPLLDSFVGASTEVKTLDSG
jgi:hypothetical protein